MNRPQTPHFREFLIELRKCMQIQVPELRKKEIDVLVEFFLQHDKTTVEERLYLHKVKQQAATVLMHMKSQEN